MSCLEKRLSLIFYRTKLYSLSSFSFRPETNVLPFKDFLITSVNIWILVIYTFISFSHSNSEVGTGEGG